GGGLGLVQRHLSASRRSGFLLRALSRQSPQQARCLGPVVGSRFDTRERQNAARGLLTIRPLSVNTPRSATPRPPPDSVCSASGARASPGATSNCTLAARWRCRWATTSRAVPPPVPPRQPDLGTSWSPVHQHRLPGGGFRLRRDRP